MMTESEVRRGREVWKHARELVEKGADVETVKTGTDKTGSEEHVYFRGPNNELVMVTVMTSGGGA